MNTLFLILYQVLHHIGNKPTNAFHADSSGVYTSDKNLNLSTIDKNHIKCDVIDSSILNGLRQPILLFLLR